MSQRQLPGHPAGPHARRRRELKSGVRDISQGGVTFPGLKTRTGFGMQRGMCSRKQDRMIHREQLSYKYRSRTRSAAFCLSNTAVQKERVNKRWNIPKPAGVQIQGNEATQEEKRARERESGLRQSKSGGGSGGCCCGCGGGRLGRALPGPDDPSPLVSPSPHTHTHTHGH